MSSSDTTMTITTSARPAARMTTRRGLTSLRSKRVSGLTIVSARSGMTLFPGDAREGRGDPVLARARPRAERDAEAEKGEARERREPGRRGPEGRVDQHPDEEKISGEH